MLNSLTLSDFESIYNNTPILDLIIYYFIIYIIVRCILFILDIKVKETFGTRFNQSTLLGIIIIFLIDLIKNLNIYLKNYYNFFFSYIVSGIVLIGLLNFSNAIYRQFINKLRERFPKIYAKSLRLLNYFKILNTKEKVLGFRNSSEHPWKKSEDQLLIDWFIIIFLFFNLISKDFELNFILIIFLLYFLYVSTKQNIIQAFYIVNIINK